ncbi:MAG: acylphosphatase [Clostridium fessum]
MVRKHIFFSGNVQGVGFRYRSFYIAQSLGLTGWVENLWDGRVEDGDAGKRSFHSGNVSSDSAAEMDQRDGYGDHRDSL